VNLRITWSGGTTVFGEGQNPTVGRVPECSVTIADAQVSRAHLSFVLVDGRWTFEDTSSNGTFIGGQRVTVGAIAGPIEMRLGGPAGPVLQVAPVAVTEPSAPLVPPTLTPPPPPPAASAAVAQPAPAPALPPAPEIDRLQNTVRLDDRQLRLELDGTMHVFNGTWIDGKRVTRQRIEGAFFVLLGDDDAGEPVRVITAGEHRKPKDRTALLVAGTALGVALLSGLLAVIFWPDTSEDDAIIAAVQAQLEEQQMTAAELRASQEEAERQLALALANGGGDNSAGELRAARLATGLISVPAADGEIIGTGSGALVSDDGLVLTNIHVVLPGLEYERTDGNPVDVGWGCLRNYDEGYLNLAGETLEGGSSGGPILRNGQIVGIQLGFFGDPGASSAQNLGVPIDLIREELF